MKELNNEEKQKVLELYEDTFKAEPNNIEKIKNFFNTRDLLDIGAGISVIKDWGMRDDLTIYFVFDENAYLSKFDNFDRIKRNIMQLVCLCDTTDLYELNNIYDDLKGE